jgi:hypothetical protein
MTLATARRWGVLLCGAAGTAAALLSAVLIYAVVSRPEQVVTEMDGRDVEALLGLIADGLVAVVREIVRYL